MKQNSKYYSPKYDTRINYCDKDLQNFPLSFVPRTNIKTVITNFVGMTKQETF